jgi:hypothetical protein
LYYNGLPVSYEKAATARAMTRRAAARNTARAMKRIAGWLAHLGGKHDFMTNSAERRIATLQLGSVKIALNSQDVVARA